MAGRICAVLMLKMKEPVSPRDDLSYFRVVKKKYIRGLSCSSNGYIVFNDRFIADIVVLITIFLLPPPPLLLYQMVISFNLVSPQLSMHLLSPLKIKFRLKLLLK